MQKYCLTFYHQRTHVRVDVTTWANSKEDAMTKAVECLDNSLMRHEHTDVLASEVS